MPREVLLKKGEKCHQVLCLAVAVAAEGKRRTSGAREGKKENGREKGWTRKRADGGKGSGRKKTDDGDRKWEIPEWR